MASIIPGFEYDIFVSYRHNDNRDGWVTEFINNLNRELAATIKVPVSVYFDSNTHDGLLENHSVDKSLKGKLKCLIFIPVISQTYCDASSFAWQHEFCAFNQLAKEDVFGRDITLNNGNVASRILPVKIHDLDAEDKALLENELGGAVRAIDFIFKSPGVNRPLRVLEDHPQDNLNKTFYRDQLNKVANGIKEIIYSLKNRVTHSDQTTSDQSPPFRSGKRKTMVTVISLLLLLGVFGVILYPRIISSNKTEEVPDKSIAVLPFVNMSNDKDQEPFSDGMTTQIIANLAKLKVLNVIGRTSVMHYKGTAKTIPEIARELNNVSYVLEGSIQKSGNRIKVNAQLIQANNSFHQWAEVYDRKLTDVFAVEDELSAKIAQALLGELQASQKDLMKTDRPANIDAYEHYLRGYYLSIDVYYVNLRDEDFVNSELEFKEAIQLDSNYALAFAGLADLYDTKRNFKPLTSKEKSSLEKLIDEYSEKALELGPDIPYVLSVRGGFLTRSSNPDFDRGFQLMVRSVQLDPSDSKLLTELSGIYNDLGLHPIALELKKKCVAIDPAIKTYESGLALTYLELGDWRNAEIHYLKGITMQPNSIWANVGLFRVAMWKHDLKEAERLLDQLVKDHPEVDFRYQKSLMFALKGEKAKALSLEKEPTAELYSLLGMTEEAFDRLQKRNLKYFDLRTNPFFENIRRDPRFQRLLDEAKIIYDQRLEKYGFKSL